MVQYESCLPAVGSSEDEPRGQVFLLPETKPCYHQDHSPVTQGGLSVGRVFQGPCPVAIPSRMLQDNPKKSLDIFILSGLSSCQSRKNSWGFRRSSVLDSLLVGRGS